MIRVRGGPFFLSQTGKKSKAGHTGFFMFTAYHEDKGGKYLIVSQGGSRFTLVIERNESKPIEDGLIYEPYKISKVNQGSQAHDQHSRIASLSSRPAKRRQPPPHRGK
jgi:hypothetical protein